MHEDNVFNPDLYLKLKASQKVVLSKKPDRTIHATFPIYDTDTGDIAGTRDIIVYEDDLLDMRNDAQQKLDKLNQVLADVAAIPKVVNP